MLSNRDSELILFDRACQASTRGDGAVLLISGPVGAGKTALLQEMVARAGRRDMMCFVVSGSAQERGHQYGVLHRLVRAWCAAGMTDPFPGGVNTGEDFFTVMNRLSAAFLDFTAGRPVVIGVDDVHFADDRSLRCLSYLIPRTESSGVVSILTESSSYEREMTALRAETLHLAFGHRIRLAPLTRAGVADQLRQRFAGEPDPASVEFCAEVSGGIPLLLQALIEDGAGEPGEHFRQAVLRDLYRCAPSTAAVAHAMAVLGDHGVPDLAAELSGLDLASVAEGVRDLREMGLLAGERFRHPHIRSAVLAGIPLRDLPGMHSRAAELLYESSAPAMAGAEHLIAAQDGGKAPWRVAMLGEAAREAMAAGDVDSALTSLRHAINASSDEAERARTGVLLADAQWHADPSRAARLLGDLVRDARSGLLTRPDLLGVVNQLLWWGEFAQVDALLAEGKGGDSCLAQLWAFFCRVGSGPVEGRGEVVPPTGTGPMAEAMTSGPMAAATYLNSAAILAFDEPRASRPEQMLLGIRAGAPFTPALYALIVLVQTGRPHEALAWCDRLLKEDWIARVPMRRVMIGAVKSVAALRDGDSATALRCVQEVFDAVPPPAWGVVAGLPLALAIRAATESGDEHAARSYLAAPVPPAMFGTPFALPYLQALGRYHATMGHTECASMHLRSCLELARRWGVATTEVAAALADLEKPAPRPPAPEASKLTDAEQRVAALAAAGNTNRQIAEHLFITVSTVEQHLTKVYRKLNVRSRAALQRLGS